MQLFRLHNNCFNVVFAAVVITYLPLLFMKKKKYLLTVYKLQKKQYSHYSSLLIYIRYYTELINKVFSLQI